MPLIDRYRDALEWATKELDATSRHMLGAMNRGDKTALNNLIIKHKRIQTICEALQKGIDQRR